MLKGETLPGLGYLPSRIRTTDQASDPCRMDCAAIEAESP